MLRVVRSVRAVVRPSALPTMQVAFAGSKAPFGDREKAVENMYFNKKEEALLRGLLSKMKHQADEHEPIEAEGVKVTERGRLLEIVEKYSMSEEDLDRLITWRHNPNF